MPKDAQGRTTKHIKCSCKHGYQDRECGDGIRLHNYARKGRNGEPGWRCTVCCDVKVASQADIEKAGKT